MVSISAGFIVAKPLVETPVTEEPEAGFKLVRALSL